MLLSRMPGYLRATAGALLLILTGCAMLPGDMADSGNEIHVREDGNAALAKRGEYPLTLRVGTYADARNLDSPRRAGVATSRILGMAGRDIMLDRDVAEVVAAAARRHFTKAGMQVLTEGETPAQFQLSGTVKDLTINVKERDYVSIAIESTLTETASGKVIWSGVVVEKGDRFAGVSGNNKKDVAEYLKKELGIVMGKTADSILSVLMATRPELFHMVVGIKPVQGVSILSNEVAAASSVVAAPAAETAGGTLVVVSAPSRAKVYVDGIYFGLTPLRAEAVAGVHEVSVRLDGHKPASEKVSVRKGENTELEMKLQR